MVATPAGRIAGVISAALLASLGLLGVAGVAQADPQDEGSVPTMIILDGSGSMLDDDAPGPRIDAAKKAIHGLVDRLPDDARIGLQVYGTSTGGSGAEKAAGCKDVKTLVPVGPVDRTAFLKAVDAVKASGYTPIGNALKKAAEELPVEGPKAIVLVSDGIDTCSPPPPCDVAKDLAKQGIDLTVHTVGFRVDKDARKELQCIAEATEGTYADAKDADELSQAIQHKVEYAISGYDVQGTPVKGAATRDADDVPLLTPGQYVDAIPAQGEDESEIRRYYKIDPPEGWTPRVSVVGAMPPTAERNDSGDVILVLESSTDTEKYCGRDYTVGTNLDEAVEPLVVAAKLECSGETTLTVIREDKLFKDQEMPLEIVVRFEPPADVTGVPAPEERGMPERPERSAEVLPITAGTSFNNAVELTPGQTYSDSIVDGEYHYFKIPVSWGQQLAWSFEPTGREGDRDAMVIADARLYGPMRNDYFGARTYDFWYGPGGKESFPVWGGTTEPVRYTSRTYPLDGFYYLQFRFGFGKSDDPVRQDFEFTVDTPGEVEAGPAYLTEGPQASVSPSSSATPTATAPASASPSPSATPTDQPSGAAEEAAPEGAGAGTIAALIAGGVLLLGVGVVGGVLLARRGSRR